MSILGTVSVSITDASSAAEAAQTTADTASAGVTSLNTSSIMSVIEKQSAVVQFASLTSQYNVILEKAENEGIDTTALTTAYTNLNTFMADILADTTELVRLTGTLIIVSPTLIIRL